MSTLISHEIPKQLFPQHHLINDYPYLLCHLLDETGPHYDKEYAAFYKKVVKEYDYSILDNSAFELGDAYDSQKLYEIGEKYKPSHLILPDALHDKDLTQERAIDYISKFGKVSHPQFIGVIQGKSFAEFVELYNFYASLKQVDVIAIPFDLYTEEQFKTLQPGSDAMAYKTHRVDVVASLSRAVVLKKPLHLLGCATPSEFTMYNSTARKFIKSVDTSAPIVYGWSKIAFEANGVEPFEEKPKDKLAENLDIKLTEGQLTIIGHNVRQFRTNLFNT